MWVSSAFLRKYEKASSFDLCGIVLSLDATDHEC